MSDIIFRDGELVFLRPLEQTDAPSLQKWINDVELTQFLLRDRPVGEKEERRFIELSSSSKVDVVLGIVTKNEGKLIGTIGLHNIDHVHGHAVTGTLIGEKEYWNKGYGTEAKMLLLDLAFNRLNLSVIRSDVIAYNGRSIAYAKKCGYRQVGRLPGWIERDGKRHDEVILVVTAKRWRPLWEAYLKNRNVS
jgi:RimJ/RimL family protein N-acetyltransferase